MSFFGKQTLKRKIGLNTLYQVAGRFVTAATGLLVTKLIIQKLGLSGYGDYQIAITYVTIYWLVTDFGLNAVVVREMSAHPEKEQSLFSALVTLRTFLSGLLAIISTIILIFLPYTFEIKVAIILGTITFFTQGMKGAIHGLFQTRLRYEFSFIEGFVGSIVFLGSLYYVLNTNPSVLMIVGSFVLGQTCMLITSIFLANKLARFTFNFDRKLLKNLAIMTLPFGISLLFNLGNFKLDSFLLSIMPLSDQTNAEAVGIYNVAYKFFEFALIIPTFLMNAVYPVMVRKFEENFASFRKLFWQTAAVLLTMAVSGFIATFFLAEWVISLVADISEFRDSAIVLKILIAAAPIFFLSSLCMWAVLTFKDQKLLIWVYAAAFFVNLTSNLILIPRYAYFGASITTGLSELVILGLLTFFLAKKWRVYQNDHAK